MALRLREPERDSKPRSGGEKSEDTGRGAGGHPLRKPPVRKSFLRGLFLFSAFVMAGLAVLFVEGSEGEKTVATGSVAPVGVAEVVPDRSWAPVWEAVRGASPSEGPSEGPRAEPGFDVGALGERVEELVGGSEGVYGVAVLDADSGTRYSYGGDEEFMPASVGKLAPLAVLYKAAARGELDLDEEITILPEDFQSYGSGSLHAFPTGHSLTLRDVAYRLVNHSDNTAWAMLDRRLGEEEIRAELEEMGMEKAEYSGHRTGYYTTPEDVLLLLEKISAPSFTSKDLSTEMLDAMTETSFEDRIPEKLPPDVRVAHKTGSYGDNFGDAGTVIYEEEKGAERRYHLVVLASGVGEYEARDNIQQISLAVYEELTGKQADPEWSRGASSFIESATEAPVEPAEQPAAEYDTQPTATQPAAQPATGPAAGPAESTSPQQKGASEAGPTSPENKATSSSPTTPPPGSYSTAVPQKAAEGEKKAETYKAETYSYSRPATGGEEKAEPYASSGSATYQAYQQPKSYAPSGSAYKTY